VSTPVLLVYRWLRCLHSRRSSRWNERCTPTWSGSSMSSPRRCAIFDIAFSQIAVSTVQDHHGMLATQDPPPHHPSHCQHAQFQKKHGMKPNSSWGHGLQHECPITPYLPPSTFRFRAPHLGAPLLHHPHHHPTPPAQKRDGIDRR